MVSFTLFENYLSLAVSFALYSFEDVHGSMPLCVVFVEVTFYCGSFAFCFCKKLIVAASPCGCFCHLSFDPGTFDVDSP